MENLAERIRKKRKSRGLTQAEFADRLGMSEMTIRRWEADKRSPRMEEIKKIAEALNTSVEYLMGLTDDALPPERPLEKLLENIAKSLPVNSGVNNENKDNAEIRDPLAGDDLDLSYWGGVVERAERAARSSDNGKKALIAGMLRMALDAVTGTRGATGKQAPVEVHHNNINGRDFNFAAQV